MKHSIQLKLGLLIVLLLNSSSLLAEASVPERVEYEGDPLTVSLSVGNERRVTFPHPVYVDIPDSLMPKVKTQIVGSELYWSATESFPPVRVVVGEEGGNRVYLLNLQGVAQDKALPRLIVSSSSAGSAGETKAGPSGADNELPLSMNQSRLGYGGLFRYAALQLYAPARLRAQETGYDLTPGPIPMGRIHHLVRYHRVETYAMASWHNDAFTVTALSVKNVTDMTVTLDPREIRGNILAARFHANHLRPGELTTLFVITRRPLAESITGHAVRIDPPRAGEREGRTSVN
jgi:integrating conjugative element protein (TIGR03749 family)